MFETENLINNLSCLRTNNTMINTSFVLSTYINRLLTTIIIELHTERDRIHTETEIHPTPDTTPTATGVQLKTNHQTTDMDIHSPHQ